TPHLIDSTQHHIDRTTQRKPLTTPIFMTSQIRTPHRPPLRTQQLHLRTPHTRRRPQPVHQHDRNIHRKTSPTATHTAPSPAHDPTNATYAQQHAPPEPTAPARPTPEWPPDNRSATPHRCQKPAPHKTTTYTDPPHQDAKPAPHPHTRPHRRHTTTTPAPPAKTPNSYGCSANSSNPPPYAQYSNPHTPPNPAPAPPPAHDAQPNTEGTTS